MFARLCSRVRGVSVDAGATLVEVMVVVAMVGSLTAMAVWGVRGWAASSAHKGAAQQVQSVLRTTQQRAITEGTSYCVEFNTATDQYAVFRFGCGTDPAKVKTAGWYGTGSARVHLSAPAFRDASLTPRTWVTFTPRGSAWPGEVVLTRDDSSKKYPVLVEGMTGRVSLG